MSLCVLANGGFFSDSVASKITETSIKTTDLLSYLNLWQRHQGTDELVAVEDDDDVKAWNR